MFKKCFKWSFIENLFKRKTKYEIIKNYEIECNNKSDYQDNCSSSKCPPNNCHSSNCLSNCRNLDIIIENDKTISSIKLHDCNFIILLNCPKITKIPDMHFFYNLEIIKVQHCTINTCYTHFPDSLRTLEMSYCCMTDFSPANLSINLAEINLSFNNLKSIPKIIETLYEANKYIKINLINNDFWYSMYSDLSPSMICAETIKELVFANKLNIVSTLKLRNAIDILNQKKLSKEAKWLSQQIGVSLEKKKYNIFSNPQNIHLVSIQDNVTKAIDFVMNINIPVKNTISMSNAIKHLIKMNVSPNIIDFLNSREYESHYHSIYKVTYKELFEKVYTIIQENPNKDTLINIFIDEIKDGIDTCFTGQMTRLVNSLNGFVPGVNVTMSKTEELSNSIVALRNKYALMYGQNTDNYIQETIPAVWQLLEDMCVPEVEHDIWLEYV